LKREYLNLIVKELLTFLVPIWTSISPECKDLISKMLVPAEQRISAQDVLNHPWIKKFADKKEAAVVTPILTKNLKTFRGAQKVKKAVLTYLATQLSEKEIEPMKKLFLSIDANGDGRLSREEIQAGFKGRSDEKELLDIMAAMDTDGSGFIDYNGKLCMKYFRIYCRSNWRRNLPQQGQA
jgi:calcium-dependent protein kinase